MKYMGKGQFRSDWLLVITEKENVKMIAEKLYNSFGLEIFGEKPLNIKNVTILSFWGAEELITRIGLLLLSLRESTPLLQMELIDKEGLI